MKTLDTLKKLPIFGIAGNFAEHLTQAGENADFVNIHTEDEKAPKGVFPIYLPQGDSFLSTFPLSDRHIQADFREPIHLHMEPEVCILFAAEYDENHRLTQLTAKAFSAFNDCSIRRPNAKKISEKKNWGHCCTGISNQWIPIDRFDNGGVLDAFHIASYLKRDGQLIEYGVDSPILGYNYLYQQLVQWLLKTFNTQTDFGPLENLHNLLAQQGWPTELIVSLGATRYTLFGETGFLQPDDEVAIFVYNPSKVSPEQLMAQIENPQTPLPETDASSLIQTVRQQPN